MPMLTTTGRAAFPAGLALLALQLLVTPSVAHGQDARASAFARVEYWQCPDQGRADFERLIDEVWGPLFDRMVKEGLFTSWSAMAPVDAREVGFTEGRATLEPGAPAWSWVISWRAVDRAALEQAWPEYHRRLAAEFPDRAGPDAFCSRVRIVSHRVLR